MKFAPGDVVYLKSAYVSGGVPANVMECHEATETDHEKYDLLVQSRDGESLCSFTAPVFVLIGEPKATALQ